MDGLKIRGTGAGIPGIRFTNDDLSRVADTSDEWIFPRTGIHERRFCKPEESALTLACQAARQAIAASGLGTEAIDAVVAATLTADFATPALACLVSRELGLREGIPCLDINAACSGFVYGLEVARGLLGKRGRYALVIGAEQLSRLMELSDRSTSILFGDGAGAAVVEKTEVPEEDYAVCLGARGDRSIIAPGLYTGAVDGFYGDSTEDPEKTVDGALGGLHRKVDHLMMDGKEVFKFAIDIVPRIIREVLEEAELSLEDIDHVVLHQANARIIRNVVHQLKAPEEKFFSDIEYYGNTSAASIPMALADMQARGLLKKNGRVLLAGFGSGLTWGSMILRTEI